MHYGVRNLHFTYRNMGNTMGRLRWMRNMLFVRIRLRRVILRRIGIRDRYWLVMILLRCLRMVLDLGLRF